MGGCSLSSAAHGRRVPCGVGTVRAGEASTCGAGKASVPVSLVQGEPGEHQLLLG